MRYQKMVNSCIKPVRYQKMVNSCIIKPVEYTQNDCYISLSMRDSCKFSFSFYVN
jgi:hypothetical protein